MRTELRPTKALKQRVTLASDGEDAQTEQDGE